LQIVLGDITCEKVDAIVNAANERLQHGGGLSRAILKRGGPTIQQESNAWVQRNGPVSHAEPAWTTSGRLAAKTVIHAVGPVWGSGEEQAKLAAAVTGSLRVAEQLGLSSIALPAISTGIFGYPTAPAAEVILGAIEAYFQEHPDSSLKLIRLVLWDHTSLETFLKTCQV